MESRRRARWAARPHRVARAHVRPPSNGPSVSPRPARVRQAWRQPVSRRVANVDRHASLLVRLDDKPLSSSPRLAACPRNAKNWILHQHMVGILQIRRRQSCALFKKFNYSRGPGRLEGGKTRKALMRRHVWREIIPVFGRTGNFNSLFGRINSLFALVGNFAGTVWNRWAFMDGFSKIGRKNEKFPAFFPIRREFDRTALEAPASSGWSL